MLHNRKRSSNTHSSEREFRGKCEELSHANSRFQCLVPHPSSQNSEDKKPVCSLRSTNHYVLYTYDCLIKPVQYTFRRLSIVILYLGLYIIKNVFKGSNGSILSVAVPMPIVFLSKFISSAR